MAFFFSEIFLYFVCMTIEQEILTASYWEHFKTAKDYAMVYPIDHPKRKELEKAIQEIQARLNSA